MILGSVPVARAQQPKPGTPAALKQAVTLTRRANAISNLGKYAEAVKLYQQALQLYPKLAGAHRNMGLAHEGLKQWQNAINAYERYLKLAGTGGRYSLAVMARINACLAKLGKPPKVFNVLGLAGRLILKVGVKGALISLNGIPRGSSPTPPLPVNPGVHVVKVTKRGYLDWTRSVGVKSGERLVIQVKLKKDPKYRPPRRVRAIVHKKGPNESYLIVRSDVPDVHLYANGKPARRRSDGVFLVKPGKYLIEVRAPGRLTWRCRVDTVRGLKKTLNPILPVLRRRKTFNTWGWVTLGVAAVLTGVGAAFGALENGVYEDVRDRQAADRAELQDLVDKGKRYRNIAYGLYAGAAAAAITSVILFVIKRKGEHPKGVPLPLVVGPTKGGGLAVSFSQEVDF